MKFIHALLAVSLLVPSVTEAKVKGSDLLRKTNPEFLKSDEGLRVGRQVLAYQRVTGGWPKNINMSDPLTPAQMDSVIALKGNLDDSTTDNNATFNQMRYLAHLYQATGDTLWLGGFRRGLEFLLTGQYDNGGWPQFWPENHGYQKHITYNDHAMVNTLETLRNISAAIFPYNDMVDKDTQLRIDRAFAKGIECILATQIRDKEGNLTVWCQQHYAESLLPAPARSYELPSYCSSESTRILGLLMSLPMPDERVKAAVHAGMGWLDSHRLDGVSIKHMIIEGRRDIRLVEDADAPHSLWGRFYDLDNAEPYVCDRDGQPKRSLEEIGYERRTGYGWYNDSPLELYPLYEEWAAKYDPDNKVTLHAKQISPEEKARRDQWRHRARN